MSIVGVLAAGTLLARHHRDGHPKRLAHRMNVTQTAVSAGNAAATALVFTLPVLFFGGHDNSVTISYLMNLGLAIAGGISLALILVTLLVASTPNVGLDNADKQGKGPEADAMQALIRGFSVAVIKNRLMTDRKRVVWGMVLAAVACLLFGVLEPMFHGAFLFTIPLTRLGIEATIPIGLNPAFFALGVLNDFRVVRGIFAGTLLGLVFLVTGVSFGDVNSGNTSTVAIKCVAAALLGLGSIVSLIHVAFRLSKEGRLQDMSVYAGLRQLRHDWKGMLLPAMLVALSGLGSIALISHRLGYNAGVVTMVACVGAVLATVLAQQMVALVGATIVSTSSLSLLMVVVMLLLWPDTDQPTLVLLCAFVVSAGSASADLAQDLLVGQAVRTDRAAQIMPKWIASMLAVPIVVAFVAVLLANTSRKSEADHFDETKTFSAPQAVALDGLAKLLRDSNINERTNDGADRTKANRRGVATGHDGGRARSFRLMFIGALLLVSCLCFGVNPMMVGMGILVPLGVSVPLMLGALFGAVVKQRRSQAQTSSRTDAAVKQERSQAQTSPGMDAAVKQKRSQSQSSPSMNAAMATALGTYSVGILLAYVAKGLNLWSDRQFEGGLVVQFVPVLALLAVAISGVLSCGPLPTNPERASAGSPASPDSAHSSGC